MEIPLLTEKRLQILRVIAYSIIYIYKFTLASMLAIFVPQNCSNIDSNTPCSLSDNIFNITLYNKVVLIFNFITLSIFSVTVVVEFYREIYCINYLVIETDKPWNNLSKEFKNMSDYNIKLFLTKFEYYYYILVNTLILANIINISLSFFLLYFYYLNYTTFIVFLTYITLIFDKLVISWYASQLFNDNGNFIVQSCYTYTWSIFNSKRVDETSYVIDLQNIEIKEINA